MNDDVIVEERDLGRIMAFTDGVMAVAITLLVLNIDVPELPFGAGESELVDALYDLLPSVGAYALSFALIGRFWVLHHRLFETLRAFDGVLMTLNLLFLALIALVPFATDLSDRYGKQSIAAAVFGLTIGLAALVHWLMARYSLRKGFVHERHLQRLDAEASAAALLVSGVFLLSVPLAFVAPLVALALWVSTFFLRSPLLRRLRRS
jgi:TMEM175 potassium channel family protein